MSLRRGEDTNRRQDRQQTMEPLWSPVVATGGNQWQIRSALNPPKQAKSIADGCDPLPVGAHGKEGVDASSPSQMACMKCLQIALLCCWNLEQANTFRTHPAVLAPHVRRLTAADMYGTTGSARRRSLIRAEFLLAVALCRTLGMLGVLTGRLWALALGAWLIGAGLNYAALLLKATHDGAFMEPRGCNRWQSVANRIGVEAARTSRNRFRGLRPVAERSAW
jgi:hypothetical protein